MKDNKNRLIIGVYTIFLILIITGNINAYIDSYGLTKQNDCITWTQKYYNSTYTNFTSITYPNQTKIIFSPEISASKSGSEYYYENCDYSSVIGEYEVCGYIDVDGVATDFCVSYEVTESGNDNPDGLVIVVYSILFFILLAWMLFTLFWNIAMMAELKTDIKDVMYSILGYFGIIAYYYFAGIYFAKEMVLDMSLWMIQIGSFTHVFLPLVGFVLFMTIGRFKQ